MNKELLDLHKSFLELLFSLKTMLNLHFYPLNSLGRGRCYNHLSPKKEELEEYLLDQLREEASEISLLQIITVADGVFRYTMSKAKADQLLKEFNLYSLCTSSMDMGILRHQIMDYCLAGNEMVRREKQKDMKILVSQVMRAIETRYKEPNLTLQSLSEMLRVTPNYLSSQIRKYQGNTFVNMLIKKRMEVAKELLKDEDLKISGFITKPSMLKSSRSWQTYIVNGRIIQNRAIAKAIDNAYRSLIPKSGFPFAVLKIEVPQRTIDVNVHPQKSEMKFEDESRIFKAVYKSVLDAIRPSSGNLTEVAAVVEKPKVEYSMEPMQFVPASSPAPQGAAPRQTQGSYQPRTIYEAVSRPVHYQQTERHEEVADGQHIDQSNSDLSNDQSKIDRSAADSSLAGQPAENTGRMMPIGQVDLTYIIAQDLKGLYIIDQHAAHERILFDKLSAMADGIPSQQLLVHQLLTFDRKEAALVEDNKELFAKLGFHLEAAGDFDYRLMEVPADVPVGEAEDIIREIYFRRKIFQ